MSEFSMNVCFENRSCLDEDGDSLKVWITVPASKDDIEYFYEQIKSLNGEDDIHPADYVQYMCGYEPEDDATIEEINDVAQELATLDEHEQDAVMQLTEYYGFQEALEAVLENRYMYQDGTYEDMAAFELKKHGHDVTELMKYPKEFRDFIDLEGYGEFLEERGDYVKTPDGFGKIW